MKRFYCQQKSLKYEEVDVQVIRDTTEGWEWWVNQANNARQKELGNTAGPRGGTLPKPKAKPKAKAKAKSGKLGFTSCDSLLVWLHSTCAIT